MAASHLLPDQVSLTDQAGNEVGTGQEIVHFDERRVGRSGLRIGEQDPACE
jgi:hypothetical protein